jgi:hypothetical protein
MPKWLQTTGDPLHDKELDDINKRLSVLEKATQATSAGTTTAAQASTSTQTFVAGVSSLNVGGAAETGDLTIAPAGMLVGTQSGATPTTLTLTVPLSTATPGAIAATGAHGSSIIPSRDDHTHAGVSSFNGSTGAITGVNTINGLSGTPTIISAGGCTVTVLGSDIKISVP